MSRAASIVVLCLFLSLGCTLEAGEGFATMEPGELEVQLDPASARVSGATVLTDMGYEVALDAFEIDVAAVELQELVGGGGGGGSFDPADPPPGFTLCHGGHCHSDEGGLVSYEEIQAMLSGGAVSYEPLVTMAVDALVNVLSGEAVALARFEPSRELPRGTISRVFLPLEAVRLRGRATGGDLGEASVEVNVDAAVSGGFVATVSRPVNRDQAQTIELSVVVPVSGTLFDGVDFATESSAEAAVVRALLGTDIRVEFD